MAVRTYRDLMAWQRGMDLAVEVYKLTRQFPKEEIYALTSQVRRAAVSVPSNIAEGQARGDGNAFANHLLISLGSVQEMETQLLIAQRIGYVTESDSASTMQLADEAGKLLRGLHQSLRTSTSN